MIYVTHDQVEAMTMGHRIAIMNDGVLQQVGPPQDVYERPANLFVARFIGNPPMNTVAATVVADGEAMSVDGEGAPRPVDPGHAAAVTAAGATRSCSASDPST